ncbi:MAG: hypothetical protein HYW50_00050, partial [Candidatus Diapherotrites archaeon]|nr:hypothetical protein [Candidatus Diapherotrites archaeon]
LEDFELEYTKISPTGMVTLLFEKDNITKITQMPDKIMHLDSAPITEEEFKELAQTVAENGFFNLSADEYGEFSDDNGPTIVLEAKSSGKEKIVSCQANCPIQVTIITQKAEQIVK